MIRRRSSSRPIFAWFFGILIIGATTIHTVTAEEDAPKNYYELLGVKQSAFHEELRAAFRRKVIETHPDYSHDQKSSPEEAIALFQWTVLALETLTDPTSRKAYDASPSAAQNIQGTSVFNAESFKNRIAQRVQSSPHSYTRDLWYYPRSERRNPLHQEFRNSMDVLVAMSRVIHVSSYEQLETLVVASDRQAILDQTLLLCVVTSDTESVALDSLLFPWPFAGLSPHHIWWDAVLTPVVVKYPLDTNLQTLLQLPPSEEELHAPVIYVAKKGYALSPANLEKLETKNPEEFNNFVWDQLEVVVTMVNDHDHAVDVFWINDDQQAEPHHHHFDNTDLGTRLEPNDSIAVETHVGMEFRFRDVRAVVDDKEEDSQQLLLNWETCVAVYRITNTQRSQTYTIPPNPCLDLSSHCREWAHNGECDSNSGYMHEHCPLSCHQCESSLLADLASHNNQRPEVADATIVEPPVEAPRKSPPKDEL